MYVSEVTFAHLRQAADERQLRELEFRRRLEASQVGSQTSERSDMGPERSAGAVQISAPPESPTT